MTDNPWDDFVASFEYLRESIRNLEKELKSNKKKEIQLTLK